MAAAGPAAATSHGGGRTPPGQSGRPDRAAGRREEAYAEAYARGEYSRLLRTLRAPPPWEVERTARKKAEAEAAAHARLSGGRTDKDEGG